jgi:hypothetical protein
VECYKGFGREVCECRRGSEVVRERLETGEDVSEEAPEEYQAVSVVGGGAGTDLAGNVAAERGKWGCLDMGMVVDCEQSLVLGRTEQTKGVDVGGMEVACR